MSRPPTFPTAQVVRIAVLVALLVAVIVLKGRCGQMGGQLFRTFDAPGKQVK